MMKNIVEKLPAVLKRPARIGQILYADMNQANLFSRASAMAYMTISSIVPSLAATFALISAFQPITDTDTQWFSKFRSFVLRNLAPDSGAQIVNYLERFLANLDITAIGVTGFAGTFVVLILLLRNVEQALNEIWQVSNERSLFKRFLFFWTLITLGAFVTSLVVAILTQWDLGSFLPFVEAKASETSVLASAISSILPVLAIFLFFIFIYKIGPNTGVKTRAAFIGAVVATVLFRIASQLYSLYATNNESYRNIYGALAAVPLFLLWLYIIWLVTLFGAIVAYRYQQGIDAFAPIVKDEAIKDPIEQERRIQLRALMPLMVIAAVYERFQNGNGHGLTGREIANSLDVPARWVTEGLRTAEALGFVALKRPSSSVVMYDNGQCNHDKSPSSPTPNGSDSIDLHSASDVLDDELLPTYPAEAVTIDYLMQRFASVTDRWLKDQRTKASAGLFSDLATFFERLSKQSKDDSKRTLAEFLSHHRQQERKASI